jgi:chloramphenicol-sensitive protein RarD
MSERTKGLIAMIAACIVWGLSPLAFKAMTGIPPLEVLAHRALWSLVIFGVVLALRGQIGDLKAALRQPRVLLTILLASCLIMVGWWLFIWAIQNGRATQSALGFYIFPLVAVMFGRLMFGERLVTAQWAAVGLVFIAVALLTYGAGAAPWIALVLATNFATYGVIKKGLVLGPVVSVTAEVLLMVPLALLILWHTSHNGAAHFGGSTRDTALLIFAGPLTAIPLILFSYAAQRLTLTTTGLVSYINPTLQFFCAAVVFSEPFTFWHTQAFVLIWTALALYSYSNWHQEKARLRAASVEGESGTTSR